MKGETILCISPQRWNSLWKNVQQIMSRIAVQNRVIFFEPGRDPNQPFFSEFKRNLPNFFSVQMEEAQNNVLVIPCPSTFPQAREHLPRFVLQITMPLILKINAWFLIRHVRQVIKKLDIRRPVLWLYGPNEIDLVGKFGERFSCYYNYDEFSNFIQNKRIRELVRRLDNELCRRVDVVFATSRSQWENRKSFNPNTYYSPNGVNFNVFNRALHPDTPTPLEVNSIRKPIIGFVGWLSFQIDLDLLHSIATAFPDCSLILVGPDVLPKTTMYHSLKAMPNVHFLGQKLPDRLPEYLKAVDVALIPYLLEGYTLTAYPLKLHEYLAAGRAIVATALPELQPYKHVVRIAATQSEFINQIHDALQDYDPEVINMRVGVARENTWDNRVSDIYCALQPLLTIEEKPKAN